MPDPVPEAQGYVPAFLGTVSWQREGTHHQSKRPCDGDSDAVSARPQRKERAVERKFWGGACLGLGNQKDVDE